MKKQDVNSKISEILQSYEGLEDISVSEDWNKLLMQKLNENGLKKKSFKTSLFVGATLVLIGLNVSCFAFSISAKKVTQEISQDRGVVLQNISSDLTISFN